ncbi:MAG TPA: TonB-dependent receptor [Balneolaceae bacterium]|nr:TonB-dependent receptor [Balneolaceae bacterium]
MYRLSWYGFVYRFLTTIAMCSAFLLLILPISTLQAQNSINVSGTVQDASSGNALPGVNISVKGTTTGTTTDQNGAYQLSVPSPSDTLVFSYIGYATKAIPVNGRSKINVSLSPTQISGQQLVVVGYSTEKSANITGSVSEVNVKDLTQQATASATDALQGQASGVTVVTSGQPGEAPNITIRGENTFGNNSPLYIVDGVPTTDISNLNQDDIASMNVLKDAAAASIYGARASNGVIVITTKQGSGNIKVDYSAYGGFEVPPQGNVWNMANSKEQAQIQWNATKNSGGDVSTLVQFYDPANPNQPRLPDYIKPPGKMEGDPAVDPSKYYLDPNYTDPAELSTFYQIIRASKKGTDWFHKVFKPGPTTKQNLTVSGGGDMGNYLFSLNYLDNEGTIKNQYLKRYSLRANSNYNVTDNIQVGENISYSISDNPQIASQTEAGPIGYAMRMNPIIPVYDIMGNYAGTTAPGLGNAINPVSIVDRNRATENRYNQLFGNIFAKVNVWKKRVTVKTLFGGSVNSDFAHSFQYPQYSRNENTTINQYNRSSSESYNYTWTNTATYQQTFNDVHNVKVLLGMEAYKFWYSTVGGSTQSYFSFDPNYVNLSTGSGTKTNFSSQTENTLFSLFGKVNYNYKQIYLASVTLRHDGSSKFLNHRYGYFPAGSVGWRISKESFFPKISWLNNLKLRAGYGVMGNQLNVSVSNPYTLFTSAPLSSYYAITGSNSNNLEGFQKNSIGNPNAKWEKDVNMDIGLDATLLSGGVRISADYYVKRIKDLLYNPSLPGTAGGAAPPYVNVGRMKNNGADITVNAQHSINSDMQINAKLTVTTYHNKIERIAQGVNYFSQEARRFNGHYIVRNQVGHPVSAFYGYKIIGYWNSQSEINNANAQAQKATGDPAAVYQDGAGLGRFRYKDVNGDGQITPADRTFLGNPNPNFTYGINIGFNYKNIDLNMIWYGSEGNDIWDQVKWYHDFSDNFLGGKSKALLYNSWTPNNHNAALPINETTQTLSNNEVPNSYFVQNGSYLRLKNIQIGYTLPKKYLNRFNIQKVRFYIQASNLLTITPYPGIDPSVGYFPGTGGGTSTSFGIDSGTYPTMHKYLVGVDLTF